VSLSCPSPRSLKALLAPAALSTLRDADVPPLFREPYILSGYRPVGLSWRYYVLSLFQMHNETLNVWSHLLAGVCVALRFAVFAVFRGGVVSAHIPFLLLLIVYSTLPLYSNYIIYSWHVLCQLNSHVIVTS